MRELKSQMSPDEILEKFKVGNQRFLESKPQYRDHLGDIKRTALGQTPYAIVLGCIDSRKPAEVIFDKGLGDIFNARVAGNFVNTDILGSIEFACKVSGSKLILIMGHSDCGAVKAAVDDVKLGNITDRSGSYRDQGQGDIRGQVLCRRGGQTERPVEQGQDSAKQPDHC